MNDRASFDGRFGFRSHALSLLLGFALARSVLVAAPPQTFTDSDGDSYKVKLTGPGAAAVTLDDPDLDGKGPIAGIVLAGTDATSALTITVVRVGDGRVKVGAISGADAVKSISAVKCDLTGTIQVATLESLRIGDVAAGAGLALPVVQNGGPLAFTARFVAAMQLAVPSSTLTFKARSVTGGASISAAQIAAFTVTAGDCEADIATPGKLVSLSVKGGDFKGRIAAGKIGTMSIAKDAAGKGGSILNSTITAKKITTLMLKGDLADSLVLAGATLGEDGALGGIDADADRFAAGKVGTVRIKGSMTNSILGAGFAPVDDKFRDANDGAIGGAASPLTAFTVKGQMDAQSFVGAGLLPKFVFIGGVKIKAKRDARFISREVMILPEPMVTQLDQTTAVPAAVAVSFLYTGANAVQTGVAPDAIKPALAAVLHGRVLRDDGLPLPGVAITLLGRPEFGITHSRTDGVFDMAVNGGSPLTVKFEAAGFSSVQRRLDTAQQDFSVLKDVVMNGVDAAMTKVTLGAGAPMQMHEATMQNDASGARHAALLFQPGTSAMLKMADGTTQPAASLSVRATEFTVGPNGPLAMPGALPSNSAYTYCADLSADEADAAGAASIEFDKPVYFYVENFLHFDIGIDVPSGFYNKTRGVWEAGPSGRIVKIISIAGGAANLDVDGDGNADTGATLTALSITDAERAIIGGKYAAGASIWRVPIPHFSAWDSNWPYGPPPDSGPPPTPPTPPDPDDDDCCEGSIVETQSQTLGERVALTGTPFTLNYRSDRTAGNRAANIINIPLSGSTLPGTVKRIELEVTVAGRTFTQDFPAQANLSTTFEWDGLDAFGRSPQGRQPAKVRIGNVYDGSYQRTARFGYNGNGTPITGDRTRQEIVLSNVTTRQLGPFDVRSVAVGGWTLDVHHVYDVGGRVLYQGDGTRRSVQNVARVIETIAGTDVLGFSGDGGPAKLAQFNGASGATVGPDGSVFVADFNNHRIRKIAPNGIISTYAGTGVNGFSGDGGQAINAQLQVAHIRTAADGSLILSVGDSHVRRIDPSGIITTIAGNGSSGISGDDGPALSAGVGAPGAVPALDGTVYLTTISPSLVRAVKPDGTIIRVAGGGGGADGGPALSAALNSPTDLAIGPDQSVWIGDTFSNRLRRVGADGIITNAAGGGNPATGNGDGGPATLARLNFNAGPSGTEMANDAKGNVYCTERTPGLIRCIDANGIISTVAGNGTPGNEGDGGPATAAKISPAGFCVGPDGSIYITDGFRVRRVSPPLPGFDGSDIAIPSQDGTQLFRFDATGRHLSTLNALTGAVLFTFTYETDGQLASIVDGDGNITQIVRTATGVPSAIIGPMGVRTTLGVDANGALASVVDPLGHGRSFTTSADGLLLTETDALGHAHAFTYNAQGRLTKDDAPGAATNDLARVGLPKGFFVTATNALGDVGKVQVETASDGGELRTNTDTAGGVTTETRAANGVTTITRPDGTIETVTLGPDPRFKMQAPLEAKRVTQTPGGKTLTIETTSTATLSNPSSLVSLTAFNRTTKVNGLSFTLDYAPVTKIFTRKTPLNRASTTTIDNAGRPLQVTSGSLAPRAFVYDAKGRVSTATDGTGATQRTTTSAYDAAGLLASVTDPLGRISRLAYDAAGRLTQRTAPDGAITALGYDNAGNATSITPPGAAAHVFTYDASDLPATYTAPGGAVTTYTYNAGAELTQVALPGGATVALTYDRGGRVKTRTAGATTATFTYDAGKGTLSSIAQTGGNALAFTYDGAIPLSTTWTGAVTGSVSRTINNNLLIASEDVTGASTVFFAYDNDGLLTSAGFLALTRDPVNGFATAAGILGLAETSTFDTFGAPETFAATFGGANSFSVNYTRDALGRITQAVETIGASAADTFEYSYDTAGRVITFKKNGATQNNYTYDGNGNRLTSGAETATYDAQDRLTQRGATAYTYTPAGFLATKTGAGGTTTYTYNAAGDLLTVALPGGTTIDYIIDGLARRIGKKVNGAATQGFLYRDDLRVVAELDGANALVSRFVYADREHTPAYMLKGGGVFRFICDPRGSVRLVVNASTGAVAQRLDYDAYGRVLTDTAPGFQPFGFAGGLYDSATGLVHFGERDYDADAGRFTAKDPVLFTSGETNLYAYVFGDPVNRIDPEGTGNKIGPLNIDPSKPVPVTLDPNALIDGLSGFESSKIPALSAEFNALRALRDNYRKQLANLPGPTCPKDPIVEAKRKFYQEAIKALNGQLSRIASELNAIIAKARALGYTTADLGIFTPTGLH